MHSGREVKREKAIFYMRTSALNFNEKYPGEWKHKKNEGKVHTYSLDLYTNISVLPYL